MLVIDNGIIILIFTIILIAILCQLFISHRQTQAALLWWQNRLWERMCVEGEEIRNGLLQDVFVMRRHLELSAVSNDCDYTVIDNLNKDYLKTFEKFHLYLNQLSDYLFPAHIDDSLPLAIEQLLNSWQRKCEGLEIHVKTQDNLLDNPTNSESHQLNRIILMAVDELMRISLIDNKHGVSISANFRLTDHYYELVIYCISNPHTFIQKSSIALKEIKYLIKCFKFLTNGSCRYQIGDNQEVWSFRWKYLGKD